MKRVLCGALAVILAIGCLTGCQEGNDLNSTNESSQAVSSKPNPADKKERRRRRRVSYGGLESLAWLQENQCRVRYLLCI